MTHSPDDADPTTSPAGVQEAGPDVDQDAYPDASPALRRTLDAHARFQDEVAELEAQASRLSMARLIVFIAVVVCLAAGSGWSLWRTLGVGLVAVFVGLVVWHARVIGRQRMAEARRDVHGDDLMRMTGRFAELPCEHAGLIMPGHPYAVDIDLVGPGSLLQRIDTTRTRLGQEKLAAWLAYPAPSETVVARQEAVAELSANHELRQELEAHARVAAGNDKLDAGPFLAFTRRDPWLLGTPKVLLTVLSPLGLIAAFIAAKMSLVAGSVWVVWLVAQSIFALATTRKSHDVFDLVAARRGYVEAFARTLACAETATFDAPLLRRISDSLRADGAPPSEFMRRLDRWAGLAEFRTQFPIHFFINLIVLWDLNVLLQLERFNKDVGQSLPEVFDALGELEALSALAGLHATDPAASFPEITDDGSPFEADSLAHPLLTPTSRVPNSVTLPGPGHAVLITGSNMAGKSTLLRTIGLNTALALAGGPVLTSRMRLPRLRLRASMRIDDSLQRGASYFHAELDKLRTVVDGADAADEPPIFFLLDELLRGTNARARNLGARAVLTHLLERGAMGLSATHDVALAALEEELDGRVRNAHFTDVMRGDEMIFDYTLRPGVVKTSNALRLLGMAGIAVPDDDSL